MSSGLRPPPCPTRRQRAESPGYARNAAAAGLAGGQGKFAARRAGEGAARVEGASSCLILSQGLLVLGGAGPGGTDLFRAVPARQWEPAHPRARRGTNGLGVGGEGRRGGSSGSASAAPPTTRQEPRAIVPSNAHPSPRHTAPGQLSSQGGGTGFQPARTGKGGEFLSCFGGLVASPGLRLQVYCSRKPECCQSPPLMSPSDR